MDARSACGAGKPTWTAQVGISQRLQLAQLIQTHELALLSHDGAWSDRHIDILRVSVGHNTTTYRRTTIHPYSHLTAVNLLDSLPGWLSCFS